MEKNKLIIMVGLPASGKSTKAKELAIIENAKIHSSDTLREELFGDIGKQDCNGQLFVELHKRIKNDLIDGKNVIYDATNLNYKRRKALLDEVKKIKCIKECYLMATPYELCLKQNNTRDRKVPEYVIKRMYKSIFIPQYYEGFDKIHIDYNIGDMEFDTDTLFNGEQGLNKINQDNPHHTLTIGEHCLLCNNICYELKDNFELNIAAAYHDIGKRFTKEFKNAKGDDTDIAHYYSHMNVSAYDSLFYLEYLHIEELLTITNYIQWHMQPFFMDTEKSKRKFIKLVGQDFYDNLLILHEADINAK